MLARQCHIMNQQYCPRDHHLCRRCIVRGRGKGRLVFVWKATTTKTDKNEKNENEKKKSSSRKKERVDRLVSRLGYCDGRSRVKTEFLNRNRLSLSSNSTIEIKSPSEKVDPSDVLIDGRPLESIELDGVLILFHKPKNCV